MVFDYQEFPWGLAKVGGGLHQSGSQQLNRALDFLKPVKGRVLDVGCGAGNFTQALKKARPDWRLYGVDVGRQAIALARKGHSSIEFQVGTAYRLPFRDGHFEAVTMFDVLEHLPKPQLALQEASRVLKPGGRFFLAVPLEGSLWTLHGILWQALGVRAKEATYGHVQRFTLKQVQDLLTKAGLEVKVFAYGDYWLFQLVDLVYQVYLKIAKQKPQELGTTLESQSKLKRLVLKVVFGLFTIGTNLEECIWAVLPGMDLHLGAVKRRRQA